MSAKRMNLPDSASVAIPDADGRLHAPSAARNVDTIIAAIRPLLPVTGAALEIASGTGQHVVQYGAAFPGIRWQPTDIDTDRLTSIAAWTTEAALPNIAPPIKLDATADGWASTPPRQDVIILSNLLHLISDTGASTVIAETATAVNSGGVALIYGPFRRGDEFASEGDRNFHESLHRHDPAIGYKSFQWVQERQAEAGLIVEAPINMPANNLILVARKP